MRGLRVEPPVHILVDLGHDDPGVDAVRAHEDGDALRKLVKGDVGGDRAEHEGGGEIEKRDRDDPSHDPEQPNRPPALPRKPAASRPCASGARGRQPEPMKAHLTQMFQAGIAACHPRRVLPPHLPDADGRSCWRSARRRRRWRRSPTRIMARSPVWRWSPHGTTAGSIVELFMPGTPFRTKRVSRRRNACSISPGGRAPTIPPRPAERRRLRPRLRACRGPDAGAKAGHHPALLRSGAAIGELNCVRRHLSRIKGGRLRATLTLAISDTVGGRPEDIGSGPTVADPTTSRTRGRSSTATA